MPVEKSYTDGDEELFANLAPKPAGTPSGADQKVPPMRTRTEYTDDDLRKFEQMFSEGCAPEVRTARSPKRNAAVEGNPETNRGQSSTRTDDIPIGKPRKSSAACQSSAVPRFGGRIENRQSQVQGYDAADIEQFEQLSSTRLANAGGRSDAEGELGLRRRSSYFQELHDATSDTIASVRRSFDSGRSKLTKSGSGRFRLRYFD